MKFEKLYYYKQSAKKSNDIVDRNLIIYGGTPAGITAAIQAKLNGLSVAIVEFGNYIGGMTTSGLGAEDAIGGLSKAFYKEVAAYYDKEK